MCQFLESIAYENGQFELIPYHIERISKTYQQFYPTTRPLDLERILQQISLPLDALRYKLRIEYSAIHHKWSFTPYLPSIPNTFFLVEKPSLSYPFKFADRTVLKDIYRRLPEENGDFIITRGGKLTDSFYANLAFYDGTRWWTPCSFLLKGTRRQYLLDTGRIQESRITIDALDNYIGFKRINALLTLEKSTFFSMDALSFLSL